jgi:DNA-binding transcriptional ArsR family regulator
MRTREPPTFGSLASRPTGAPVEITQNLKRACGGTRRPITYNYMVVDHQDQEQVDRVFHALADATRRDIVTRSMQGEHSVSALARRYPMSFAAVQKHVAVLEGAALVTKRRRGREQLVTGNVQTIRRASLLLDQLEVVWRERIDRFGEVLAEHPDEGANR